MAWAMAVFGGGVGHGAWLGLKRLLPTDLQTPYLPWREGIHLVLTVRMLISMDARKENGPSLRLLDVIHRTEA